MKNFFIITKQACKLSILKDILPHTRWIHHRHCEEGIASISVFGEQLHGVFITEDVSFLTPIQIQNLIKTQFSKIPVILIQRFSDILDCIQGNFNHQCIASYNDFYVLKKILDEQLSPSPTISQN